MVKWRNCSEEVEGVCEVEGGEGGWGVRSEGEEVGMEVGRGCRVDEAEGGCVVEEGGRRSGSDYICPPTPTPGPRLSHSRKRRSSHLSVWSASLSNTSCPLSTSASLSSSARQLSPISPSRHPSPHITLHHTHPPPSPQHCGCTSTRQPSVIR